MIEMVDTEKDVICELFNIGIGQAARALSELVDDTIELSVPEIQFITVKEAVEIIDAKVEGAGCAIKESFSGVILGDMMLVFPEKQSLELVRCIIGEDVELETITEMEQDALLEVGNIIMTSCLSSLADAFGERVMNEIPTILKGNGRQLISDHQNEISEDCLVLFIEVDFIVQNSNIAGYVMVILDMPAVADLRQLVAAYLEGI